MPGLSCYLPLPCIRIFMEEPWFTEKKYIVSRMAWYPVDAAGTAETYSLTIPVTSRLQQGYIYNIVSVCKWSK